MHRKISTQTPASNPTKITDAVVSDAERVRLALDSRTKRGISSGALHLLAIYSELSETRVLRALALLKQQGLIADHPRGFKPVVQK
jgi:hypothetical protein